MTLKVAIAGATGYAGGEILRLLLNHPAKPEIGALTGHSNSGGNVATLMPHLPQLGDRTIVDTTVENLAGHDVVFLALPHGHSAEIGVQLPCDVLVIDCAADFRLQDPAEWEHYYRSEPAGTWPYGIPEMPGHREAIANSKRIAIPGCFPTGATLAALPAVVKNLIEPDLVITSVTGVSGAGKKASVDLLGAETMGSAKAYNVAGAHRHTPEMEQNLGEYTDEKVTVTFTPVLAPMTRGILTTATARLREGISQSDVTVTYREFYKDEPFVYLPPEGQQPQTKHIVGSNMAHVQVVVDDRAGRLLMTSVIDNLTKGTAGAAVQCMNLALGLDETAGLPMTAVAP